MSAIARTATLIEAGLAHEERTGETAAHLSERARAEGLGLSDAEIQRTVAFIRSYIQHVPVLLHACERAAAAAGIEHQIAAILTTIERNIAPPGTAVEEQPLLQLIDEVFFVYRLLQRLSDAIEARTGRGLISLDLGPANGLARGLFGPELAASIEAAVETTLEAPALLQACDEICAAYAELEYIAPPPALLALTSPVWTADDVRGHREARLATVPLFEVPIGDPTSAAPPPLEAAEPPAAAEPSPARDLDGERERQRRLELDRLRREAPPPEREPLRARRESLPPTGTEPEATPPLAGRSGCLGALFFPLSGAGDAFHSAGERDAAESDSGGGTGAGGSAQGDDVDVSVFAPAQVSPNQRFLIQAYVHLPEGAAEAAEMAMEFDAEASRRGTTLLMTEIRRGSFLSFELKVPEATVDDPVQDLRWQGRTASVTFGVQAPSQANSTLIGKLLISQDGDPIGKISFKIEVKPAAAAEDPSVTPTGTAKRFRYAFVSYASPDRAEVLKRVQMLKLLRYEFFQDILSLDPGDRWQRELYRAIDRSDVFLLFWSSAARESEWVRREIDYAVKRKNGQDENPPEILPVIIEGPPAPPAPDGLAGLQLSDTIVYLMPRLKVEVGPDGWLRCPQCGKRFATHGETWNGRRHLTCGAELELIEAVPPA